MPCRSSIPGPVFWDDAGFERWSIAPTRAIVEGVRAEIPDACIIGFPKASAARIKDYVARTGVSAVGLDWTVPGPLAREIQDSVPVQGNLDPMRLVAGGDALKEGVANVARDTRGRAARLQSRAWRHTGCGSGQCGAHDRDGSGNTGSERLRRCFTFGSRPFTSCP